MLEQEERIAQKSKLNPPRTMTVDGLMFLKGLAAKITSGVILELGPLFGSSTNHIAQGRISNTIPIHTIDTFKSADWIEKRFGVNLSLKTFNKFTDHIKNLTVHEGFAPTIVKNTWQEQIGLYFDDATHGNPGWLDNYNFFSKNFL